MSAAFPAAVAAAAGAAFSVLQDVPSDTWFTTPAHWTWYIIPYFFIGGIAGGAFFIAGALDLLGRAEDAPVVRWGYVIAAAGAVVSGILLILDLNQPLRFWHLLVRADNFPLPIIKPWSPISVGSWGLTFFGAAASAMALAILSSHGTLPWKWPRIFRAGWLKIPLILAGMGFGLFVASYTGVLLSVTNRPVWADSPLVGAMFVASGLSTATAALLVAVSTTGGSVPGSVRKRLSHLDTRLLLLELLAIAAFLVSLGPVIDLWISGWGILLVFGVIGAGILAPLAIQHRPTWFRGVLPERRELAAAVLVLVGGFLLRTVIVLVSETFDPTYAALLP